MKNKSIIPFTIAFGVFILMNTSLFAQSTLERSSERSAERSEIRSNSRATYVVPDIDVDMPDFVYSYSTHSSDKNSTLALSKRYSGQSAQKEGTFILEEGVSKIRIKISGSVNVGEIGLELYRPGKKLVKKLVIDDSADISWSQSINIKDGEASEYLGEWIYVINAKSVEGRYNMSISTY